MTAINTHISIIILNNNGFYSLINTNNLADLIIKWDPSFSSLCETCLTSNDRHYLRAGQMAGKNGMELRSKLL